MPAFARLLAKALLLSGLTLCPSILLAQLAGIPQSGSAPFQDYQSSPIDDVNLTNGNVFLHIPLVSFPQRGHLLKLNFMLRFNAPQWITAGVTTTYEQSTGQIVYGGEWILGNTAGFKSPVGVDVVRDQGLTANSQVIIYPCIDNAGAGAGNCTTGAPATKPSAGPYSVNATRYSIRDRSGAEHSIGQYGLDPRSSTSGPISQFITAPDGSGWTPISPSTTNPTPTIYYDREGVKYTSNAPNGVGWNVSDPQGNSIQTSTSGWTDTVGRVIPGTWPSLEDDPYPGVPTSDLSLCDSGTTAAHIWTVPSVAGGSDVYKFCYAPVNVQTNFGTVSLAHGTGSFQEVNQSFLSLTQVVLPDQKSSYRFSYDSYLCLSSVQLPTGASITYTWSNILWDTQQTTKPFTRAVISRVVHDGLGNAFTWKYNWTPQNTFAPGQMSVSVDVTKPDGNDEVHVGGFTSSPSTKYYAGPATPGKVPVRTVVSSASILLTPFFDPKPPPLPNGSSVTAGMYSRPYTFQEVAIGPVTQTTTTLDDNSTQVTVINPVPSGNTSWFNFGVTQSVPQTGASNVSFTGACACIQYGLTASTDVHDYSSSSSPGPLLRSEKNYYKWNDGSSNAAAYQAANMFDLVSQQTISDASGIIASTTYGYDENNGSPQGIFGNQTSVTRSNDHGASPVDQVIYDSNAMVKERVDPMGNKTYVAATECSGLFPTQVFGAYQSQTTLQETTTFSHDCSTGKLLSTTSPAGSITKFSYSDPLRRLTLVQKAVGTDQETWRAFSYPSLTVVQVKQDQNQKGDGLQSTTTTYDGMGRVIHATDAAGATVDTVYNGLGLVQSKSNPHFSSSSTTDGTTSFLYDALGRKYQQTQQDGSTQTWTYSGASTLFKDEAGKHSMSASDALGRVKGVFEDAGGANIHSTYGYNGRGDLTSVVQSGVTGEVSRIRTFAYDSLSRLLTSCNPEGLPTGTTCDGNHWSYSYAYDANGNLSKQTDARNSGVIYGYDAFSRLKTKAYFGPGYTNPTAKQYFYDGAYPPSFTATPSTNQIGYLTGARSWAPFGNNNHDEAETYDAVGRVTRRTEISQSESGSAGHALAMNYDLTDQVTSLTYPDGRALSQKYDSAGHLLSVTDGTGTAYAVNTAFSPSGAPKQVTYGNGLTEAISQNNRLQTCEDVYQTAAMRILDRQYFFGSNTTAGQQCAAATGNNGNILHVMDGLPGGTNSQHYAYDALNRLTQWNGSNTLDTVRQQSFGYDSFGNMLSAWSGTAPTVTSQFDGGNHFINQGGQDCTAYDSAGNMTCAGVSGSNESDSVFNEEEQLVSFKHVQNNSPPLWVYSYDSTGNRVRSDQQISGSSATWREYTYLNGQVLAEKDQTGAWTDYIYGNGKRIATAVLQQQLLRIAGNAGSGGWQWQWYDLGLLHGYQIQSGDMLVWRQRQNSGGHGGVLVETTAGDDSAWNLRDTAGVLSNEDTVTPAGQWNFRRLDLSSFAGHAVSTISVGLDDASVGQAQADFADVALVSANGQVASLYTAGVAGGSWWTGNKSFASPTAAIITDAAGSEAVRYLAADQVGTTQLELSSGGYPVWRGEFAPFGQELDNQLTNNRYKFTGKERDQESGLDYFGARYYASSMGRFMSPDWSNRPEALPYADLENPQTLNLYAYAQNNPLSYRDDGHKAVCTNTTTQDADGTLHVNVVCHEEPDTLMMAGTVAIMNEELGPVAWLGAAGLFAAGCAQTHCLQPIINLFAKPSQTPQVVPSPSNPQSTPAGPGNDPDPKNLTKSVNKIAQRLGKSVRQVNDAIHEVKRSMPRGGPVRNPDVLVDTETGEVYPETPTGHGDSIGNINDHIE